MDDALGNPFVVEVEDLFAEVEVVDDERTAGADPKRILVVGNRAALCRCQNVVAIFGELVEFAAFAAMRALVVNGNSVGLRDYSFLGHSLRSIFGCRIR